MSCSLGLELPPELGFPFQQRSASLCLLGKVFFGRIQVKAALSGGDSLPKQRLQSAFPGAAPFAAREEFLPDEA